MDVVVRSTLSHIPGELIIPTSSDQTVGSVLATFCANRGIHQQTYYVLRTCAQLELDSSKRLDHYEIHDGDTLLLGLKGEITSLWPCVTLHPVASKNLINMCSGNGLMPSGINPLPEPIVTYHQ